MKDWEDRRNETIAFIRTAPVETNADKRNIVADLLLWKYGMNQAFSDSLSQGKNWDRLNVTGAKRKRKYRRAIIAINVGILGEIPGVAQGAVAGLGGDALRIALGRSLGRAYSNEKAILQLAMLTLKVTPGIFMAHYPMRIVASHVGSQSMNSLFYYDIVTREYRFAPRAKLNANGKLIIHASEEVVYIEVPVYNLDWQAYTAIDGNIGNIIGGVIQNDNIMITDQLTGCSFMYQLNGANMTAIHVQPAGDDQHARSYDLVITLRGRGGFANGPLGGGAVRVLGTRPLETRPYNYNHDRHITQVLGVLVNGTWQLWVQSRNRFSRYKEIVGSWQL